MADDIAEAGEIAAVSRALVINIGTLNARTVESMTAAGKAANEHGVPVVLDPVGAGASALRCQCVDRLLREVRFSIIRGNLSEVSYIAGYESRTKGVDSGLTAADADPVRVASAAADRFGAVTVITGAVDTVAGSGRIARIKAGCAEMGKVSHVNANDGTCEGVAYTAWNCFTVQFHPEASGGPRDAEYLFDEFIRRMAQKKGE